MRNNIKKLTGVKEKSHMFFIYEREQGRFYQPLGNK
jgi:hypothetical protein